MKSYLFTGFPGFISANLIREIIRQKDFDHIYLLVLEQAFDEANNLLNHIVIEEEVTRDKLTIVKGDITKEGLAINQRIANNIQHDVTHVFHLAALYDLAVPYDIAHKVNVIGTNHVNNFVSQCDNIERFVYFSTAYVSGDREGKIYEHELDHGQSFKNHYEKTKFEAEKLTEAIKPNVPTTIIRPGIVIGHSQSGSTSKFDGPYFILNYLQRLKSLPLIPYLGKGKALANFVPIDYIVKGTMHLAHSETSKGKTFHLTDPKPYHAQDVYEMFTQAYLGKNPIGNVPLTIGKAFLSFSSFRKWFRIEKEALDYFYCESDFDCSKTIEELQSAGITCPDLKEYLPAIVRYYKKFENDWTKHIEIT
ncbi:SDR family oxidoreductase [Alkalibacillus haloalkaliphilus]|uniref:3-beta hydroxysteroid dehydrogenase n=1 Tax=Alkalibacillus haloalkaliphilus TaxID=94136 RepID=A0A511W902_9BACI|nr:SDR family oxidoreductase [Alkalibacillus haloalkaliphilus]GEN46533.1 3-beta hydroxysteroid dehydrogenase [Alkalibacillus haloalkaliphilus]